MVRVALIAHDDEKPEMIDLVEAYEGVLSEFDLVSTGTTGKRIMEETDLTIDRKQSGPLGGDTQIGALVAEDEMDAIVFLRDPLTAQPHEPDISALLRICDVHDVPLATTRTAAEYVLDGVAADIEME
ncbi:MULTISPECIES: methylglyoxal synthase [Haloarcula]|uniref:Methylglyoxal synthase n=1 Tax=Haloarcula pellucida TaxID=1427151 RepID=A0A830GP54_9EURY|nr:MULTISPECIES: methylglyoxal synthase [Halomicroarcula]MBX0349114.1 methylglyoxal synthase [Halomicroarcula pellucida]MDS0279293.1 methylglyoxal synthase [Halomicroarcula sp. S1AR25-4]GGN99084.1 methylglyoxal synthase [Halomicroarcula pellucida]